MRWVTFMLCAACGLVLQSTIAPRLEVFGCRPDWLLVLVVFFAMHARRSDAAWGAWGIGICADLMSVERLGLIAVSYLLVAVVIASIREYFFRYRILTQAVVTGVASVLIQSSWLAYRHALYEPTGMFLGDFAVSVILASVYTAIWTPVFHGIMLKMSGVFGISYPRYLYSGLQRMDTARV